MCHSISREIATPIALGFASNAVSDNDEQPGPLLGQAMLEASCN